VTALDVTVLATQLSARVPGGTGRYTWELLRALAAMVPQGDRLRAVRLAASTSVATELEQLPVHVSALPLPFPLVSRLWERGLPPHPARAGVVHAPTLLIPPGRPRTRLVVTIHDVVPWTHPETLTARGVAFHRAMGARAASTAAALVTPTQAVADAVRTYLDPRCPVTPVLSGASVPPVPADAEVRRRRLGATAPYVLFVGTAEPRKGLDVLVAAMGAPDVAELSLVVAGPSGWGQVSAGALAEAAAVSRRSVVTGLVSDPDLASLYAGARVVVVPSRAEGFGLPVVEAMAYGVPVVTSDDPALVEVGGGATVTTPIGDDEALAEAIHAVASDDLLRRRLTHDGSARAAGLTWTATAERMWQVYAEAAAR
jgi:glycosyltransferase involved in cell wall biosynthesis